MLFLIGEQCFLECVNFSPGDICVLMGYYFKINISLWYRVFLLRSENQSFLLNRRNTDYYYGGYNLLQNTDLSQIVQAKFKQNDNL